MSFSRKSLMLLSASLVTGCMVTTRVVEHYDDDCQIVTKQVVLNTGVMGSPGFCNETKRCIGGLVGMGAMSAASVVISGSVVVVGNVVYWLEKQGNCQKKTVDKA